jgi:hypothetical protein
MSNGKKHRMNRAMPSQVGRGGGSSLLLLVSRSCDGPSSLAFGIDVLRGVDESNCGSEWSMFGAVTLARARFSESPSILSASLVCSSSMGPNLPLCADNKVWEGVASC